MFKLEEYVERNATEWVDVVELDGSTLCSIAVCDDSGFVFDDDGFVGVEFDIVGSGIRSRGTREIIGNIVNRETIEFRLVA